MELWLVWDCSLYGSGYWYLGPWVEEEVEVVEVRVGEGVM